MDATPIGMIVLGIAGVVGGIMALSGAFGHASDADAAFHAALKQVDQATGPSETHIESLSATYDHLKGSVTQATFAMVEHPRVRIAGQRGFDPRGQSAFG
jgi:hypothetical protein